MRNENIYWIAGSRDGIGKWMLATVLIDLWLDRTRWPLVVDCEATTDRDNGKPYVEQVHVERFDLDWTSGWIELLDLCERNRHVPIIVRTVGGQRSGLPRFGQAVDVVVRQLGRSLVALWMLDTTEESLQGLKAFVTAMPATAVHVVRNGYLGAPAAFRSYQRSRLRDAIEGNGGKSLWLPKLADSVVPTLRASISAEASSTLVATTPELTRWLTEAKRALQEIIAE